MSHFLFDIWMSKFPAMVLQSFILSAAVLILVFPLKKTHLSTVKWLLTAITIRMLFPPVSASLRVPDSRVLSFHSATDQVINAMASSANIQTDSLFNPWIWVSIFYFSMIILLCAVTCFPYWKIRNRVRSGNRLNHNGLSIIQTCQNHSPFVFGILKPVIVVPENWNQMTENQQRVILGHELAHIRSLDPLINLISTTACIVFFFNPLVWIMRKQLILAQECLCDETSGRDLDSSGLARILVEIAEKISFKEKAGTLAFSETYRRLTHRIQFIYEKKEAQSMFSRFIKPALIVAGMAMILCIMSIKPVSLMASDKTGVQKKETPINLSENKDVIPPEIIGGRKELAKRVQYPQELKKEKISGFVILQYEVTKTGEVKDVEVIGGTDSRFNDAAISAAKGTLYKPATLEGKPVSCILTLTIQFKLDEDTTEKKPEKHK